MRVAITGATGFTGGHTLRALVAAGHQPRALVRSAAKLERVLELHDVDGVDHLEGDVTDRDAVMALVDGCDAVIHTAAVASTGRSQRELMERTNVPGTRLVLHAAAEADLDPIVHVSSISAIHPPASGRYTADESVTASPADAYARTKADSEHIARDLQAAGAPVVIVWPSGIYGPDDVGLSVAAEGTARLLGTGVLPLPSTGGNLMHDVRDLAQVLTRCLEAGRGPRRYGVFGHYLDWPATASVIERVSGASLRTPKVPAPLFRGIGRMGDLVGRIGIHSPLDGAAAAYMTTTVPGDDSATRNDLSLSWRPAEETFADTLRWLIAQGHLDADKAPLLAD